MSIDPEALRSAPPRPAATLARRLILLTPALLFIVVMGFFALGLQHDPQVLPSALIDHPTPAFDLPPVQPGQPGFTRADLGGKPAVINFFASWCAPCRVEQPSLIALAKRAGVRLYGIDYKDQAPDALRYLADLGDPYLKIGMDASGRTGIDFGIYGVPETFLIDAAGRVRFRYPGPLTDEVLTGEILPRLKALGG